MDPLPSGGVLGRLRRYLRVRIGIPGDAPRCRTAPVAAVVALQALVGVHFGHGQTPTPVRPAAYVEAAYPVLVAGRGAGERLVALGAVFQPAPAPGGPTVAAGSHATHYGDRLASSSDRLRPLRVTSMSSAPINRRLYSSEEAAKALSLSRTKVWELMKTGELENTKIGKRRLIFADSLDRYVERLRN